MKEEEEEEEEEETPILSGSTCNSFNILQNLLHILFFFFHTRPASKRRPSSTPCSSIKDELFCSIVCSGIRASGRAEQTILQKSSSLMLLQGVLEGRLLEAGLV
jgi:hypothetical protein